MQVVWYGPCPGTLNSLWPISALLPQMQIILPTLLGSKMVQRICGYGNGSVNSEMPSYVVLLLPAVVCRGREAVDIHHLALAWRRFRWCSAQACELLGLYMLGT